MPSSSVAIFAASPAQAITASYPGCTELSKACSASASNDSRRVSSIASFSTLDLKSVNSGLSAGPSSNGRPVTMLR
jgi:hypothetical protein